MRYAHLIASGLLVAACVGGAAGGEPATKEAESPAAFVRTIQQQENPTLITIAYGRGAEMFPRSVQLHEAYVRRMIASGMVELAYQPAQVLTGLDAGHGLAWAVLAHMHAGREEYPKALAAAIKAAEHARDDPFVLGVAGQMVAWFDHRAQQETVAQSLRQSLAELRGELEKREDFTKGYKAAKVFFEELARQGQPEEPGQAEVFVPEHLKQQADASEERQRRVRELIEEIESRHETITTEYEPYPVYVSYYPYYPYTVFGFIDFGYFRHGLIFGHRFRRHHGRRPDDGHYGTSLVVTARNQKRLFGRLVVTPRHRGWIFPDRGPVGSLGGRAALTPTRPQLGRLRSTVQSPAPRVETIRTSIGSIRGSRVTGRGAGTVRRSPSIGSRTIGAGSRTPGIGSRRSSATIRRGGIRRDSSGDAFRGGPGGPVGRR